MWNNVFLVLGCFLGVTSVVGQWSCTLDEQCADVTGSVCAAGTCACAPGQQIVGSQCVDLAPYHTSVCMDDHQCSRMFTFFECRKADDAEEGSCQCQDGFHYFLGRCWRSVGYGAACSHDEECIDVPRDPYSLQCNVTCGCAPGYYERQRGECRKIAYAVGDGCVLDQDCQFDNGVCELASMRCISSTTRISPYATTSTPIPRANVTSSIMTSARAMRLHGSACGLSNACSAPFDCSPLGACVCPVGYYASDDGTSCLAELGSVSEAAQCVGFLAEVIDGVCACPPNFFYEENMRDCVKVTRRFSDACTIDENCHTFGSAALCAAPQDPWQLRSCTCDFDRAVWDEARQMCRLFAGVGEMCEIDSDCLAGELEIQCEENDEGQGYCVCPAGYVLVDGLCLTTGLTLGDACQASQECTVVGNTDCIGGYCACGDGYQQTGEDFCAPIIGGTCILDSDCVIEHTVCYDDANVFTCQCGEEYVAHNETCWPVSLGFEEACTHTEQCTAAMGDRSECSGERCVCQGSYHFRDGNCWPVTDLFQSCSRTSECFLATISERVVCRNSLCQCAFEYPYSEELHTCMSSATGIFGSGFVIITALMYLFVVLS